MTMKTNDIYLSLGTNIGDRRANIEAALKALDDGMGCHYSALSSIVESRSWGFSGPDFLNCVVRYGCSIPPEDLLALCKAIERKMGRRERIEYAPDGSRIYHDRIIDIDILLYGDEHFSTPALTVPHPKMWEREFVRGPLSEIFEQDRGND